MDQVRMTLAPLRLVPPPATKAPLPLPTLIKCIEDRVAVVHAVGDAQGVACVVELLEQALPHLQLLNRLESSSVL